MQRLDSIIDEPLMQTGENDILQDNAMPAFQHCSSISPLADHCIEGHMDFVEMLEEAQYRVILALHCVSVVEGLNLM